MAKQVRAAIEVRTTLADAMAHGARRSPKAILADAGHLSDYLMRQAIAAVDQVTEPVSVDLVDQLTAAIGRATHIAKINVDLDIDESTLSAQQSAAVTFALSVAGSALGLNFGELKVARAIAAALREFERLGPMATERRRAIDDAVAKLKADQVANREAEQHAERERTQAAIVKRLAQLRAAARYGPCEVCGSFPGASTQLPAIEAPTSQRPAQRADGASSSDPDDLDDLDGEIIDGEIIETPALSRYPSCPGCQQPRDPQHEQSCGYALATRGGAFSGRAGS